MNAEIPYINYTNFLIPKCQILFDEELKIDNNESLYLITWCPDPKHNPDADFITSHQYHINILSDYLKQCKCGLFCVEATQMGNPHYHGWYQVDPEHELERIAILKVLEKFGYQLKIKEGFHWKTFCCHERKNCLYYYKKDVFTTMNTLLPTQNPITRDTHDDTDWSHCQYRTFFTRQGDKHIEDKISERKLLREFYKNSQV